MSRSKLSAQSAQKNRLALILAAAALVLAVVLLSLPVAEFTTSIYTKRSANTFVGDEKYVAARAEAEAVLEQYADAGVGGSLKIDESVTERVNSKGETTSLVVLNVRHTVSRTGWDFLRGSLAPSRVMQLLVLCVALSIVLALLLGFVAYGLSILFYIYAQRSLGAAKTSAYYAVAPFIGVALSLALFREIPSGWFIAALIVMIAGTWCVTTAESPA